eukprot:TRINITY_DN3227_c1_g1_i2.p1 TRINITY_DN3227_c1_g1~~TRINITY_DN3227_c1_g1_i2.p1  ORF type:complete len:806 (-),score=170.50 TRINITY_DN3227_c1_g1_i2:47-2464(-)
MVRLWWLVIPELLVLAGTVFFFLRRYVAWRGTPKYVYILTYLGWYLSMCIAVLLPIDISGTTYTNCLNAAAGSISSASVESVMSSISGIGNSSSSSVGDFPNWSLSSSSSSSAAFNNGSVPTSGGLPPPACPVPLMYIEEEYLEYFWIFLYWATFLLCWLVYPCLQSFSTAGDFGLLDKLKTTVKENVLFYGVSGVVLCFMLVLVLIWTQDFKNWYGIAMSCSNAYGQLLLFLLLSYGLINIPRTLWRKSCQAKSLKACQFQVVSLKHDADKYREQLTATLRRIKYYDEIVRREDVYRVYINKVIERCPPEYADVKPDYEEGDELTFSTATKLNYNIKAQTNLARQSESLYNSIVLTALRLEDITVSKWRPEHAVLWTTRPQRANKFFAVAEWAVLCHAGPFLLKATSLACCLATLVIIWSELTFAFNDPTLSIVALAVQPEIIRISDILLTIVLILPLVYLVVATYSSLFEVRIFNYFRLLPHQQTDANSVLFSAAYLCRLAPPLAYNFLHLLKMNGTAFGKVMNYMNNVPFFGGDLFMNFIPWILLPLCVLHAFDVIPRIVRLIPVQRLQRFIYDDDFSDDQIDEGVEILRQERRARTTSVDQTELLSRGPDEESGTSSARMLKHHNWPSTTDGKRHASPTPPPEHEPRAASKPSFFSSLTSSFANTRRGSSAGTDDEYHASAATASAAVASKYHDVHSFSAHDDDLPPAAEAPTAAADRYSFFKSFARRTPATTTAPAPSPAAIIVNEPMSAPAPQPEPMLHSSGRGPVPNNKYTQGRRDGSGNGNVPKWHSYREGGGNGVQ